MQDASEELLATAALASLTAEHIPETSFVGRERRFYLPTLPISMPWKPLMKPPPSVARRWSAVGRTAHLDFDDRAKPPVLQTSPQVLVGVITRVAQELVRRTTPLCLLDQSLKFAMVRTWSHISHLAEDEVPLAVDRDAPLGPPTEAWVATDFAPVRAAGAVPPKTRRIGNYRLALRRAAWTTAKTPHAVNRFVQKPLDLLNLDVTKGAA